MKRLAFIFLLAVVAVQPACGMKKMATGIMGKVATDGMVAVEGEEDVAFARETSPPLIKTLEVLRQGNPRDVRSLVLLSRSYGMYAFGFLEEDMLRFPKEGAEYTKAHERADLFYKRGRDFGIAALVARSGAMEKAFKSPLPEFKKAVAGLSKSAVPALFWTAFNWANWLNLNLEDPAAVADLPRIQAMIDRVIELDPSYYYSSAHAFRGVIAASRPKMFGGDLNLAEKEFNEAMRAAPGYLMTRVLYAQYYARQSQDRELFRKTLKDVESADAAALKEQRLANEMAKRRAGLLLAAEKQLF